MLTGNVCVAVGLLLVLFGGFTLMQFAWVAQEKYLTDPSTPYNELENASYTITPEEIVSQTKNVQSIVILAFPFLAFGLGIVLTTTFIVGTKIERHNENCEYTVKSKDYAKYCPICGIRLEKESR